MRLLTKTSLLFLTIALFVVFTGGILFYFSFRYIMNQEVNRELVSEMHQVIMSKPFNLSSGDDSVTYVLPAYYSIIPIQAIGNPNFIFTDTMMVEKISGQFQPYRNLSFQTSLEGVPVRISISKSLIFSDQIIQYIVFVTLLLSLILLAGIAFLNKYLFDSIWGNFLKTIDVIQHYSISETEDIEFPESEIIEFNLLNQGFEKMHKRIRTDYKNLKEFIENISHEIQNPLAIIKSKIDLLQQNTNSDESQALLIHSILGSVTRLSNLNKSLILLSKIDNNQFHEKERVDIGRNIDLHMVNFEDMIEARNISLEKKYKNPVIVMADPDLMSILLLNLLKNSVFHNLPSGSIEILTEGNRLTIKNSGKKLEIDQEDLFKRFIKSSARPESLGLGLAIVKKICDYYKFGIFYSFQDKFHIITIDFN